ncbi:hypothetical protein HOP61_02120 [Halomonas daqingensis]|uniref:Uncharacterized protein n=1 Tax=Billgrantia desiderata TaxID=52021 RepID=A0AAW4YN40_9GAMM|nr:hypothetical protein [Halomonas desiderata]MCE8050093.1 hypothetical protein [Halomonas desiderata]
MKTLGVLDEERLALLPGKYIPSHEFCFFLHDKLASLLVEYDYNRVQDTVVDAFEEAIKGREDEFYDLDLVDFMKRNDLVEPYKHHILSHTVMALTSDMLHFIYEALTCLEKRKFSVAFSLLRKPLKEHLFFLSWILADEDDFISRFESKNYVSFSGVSKEMKIEIIDKAISKFHIQEAFDAETIWNYVYSKKHSNGFEPTWQRATHLTTSQGDLLKTEDYSLNFIFQNNFDDDYYEFLRLKLPYIFLYITQVVLESFSRVHPANEKTVSHLIISVMGCYEALFIDGRSMAISRMLQRHFGDILSCIHCESKLKIKKRNATDLYLHESVVCESCGLRSEVPLYWLLAKAKVTLA